MMEQVTKLRAQAEQEEREEWERAEKEERERVEAARLAAEKEEARKARKAAKKAEKQKAAEEPEVDAGNEGGATEGSKPKKRVKTNEATAGPEDEPEMEAAETACKR